MRFNAEKIFYKKGRSLFLFDRWLAYANHMFQPEVKDIGRIKKTKT